MHTAKTYVMRSQVALDFMVSYGVALLIIGIALYVVISTGVLNPHAAPSSCTPTPGFICDSYAINTSGVFIIQTSQVTGATMDITGAACASTVNSTNSNYPEYGNIHVLGYSSDQSAYPSNAMANGIDMYSDGVAIITVNCYSSYGISKKPLGDSFVGYLWLNYTTNMLPGKVTTQKVASFTVRYT